MAAKPEAKEPKEPAAPAAEAPPAPAGGGIKALLPALLAVVLAPAASFAVAEFVLLPRLQAKLALPAAAPHAASAEAGAEAVAEEAPVEEAAGGHGGGKEGKEGKEEKGSGAYTFENIVVNLSGTMGTRYLKTSFVVTGIGGKSVKPTFETQKPKLTDITLSVLSSLTLADLEEPGAKNVLREKLVTAYNQALGKRLVEQIYFSDFVIQ